MKPDSVAIVAADLHLYADMLEEQSINKYDAVIRAIRMYARRLDALELDVAIEEARNRQAIPGTDTLLKVGGKSFRCNCGANVFSKTKDPNYYRCNGCDAGYEAG